MKFAYCGFDFFDECLKACLANGHELLMAYSHEVDGEYNTDTSVRSLCADKGVTLRTGRITSEDIGELSRKGCQFLLSAAYVHRIPANELEKAGIKGMNIHPTLLPDGRGPWPLPHVILKCLRKSGVTIHKLSHQFDAGDILIQDAFDVMPDENLETLSCKTQILAPQLVTRLLRDLESTWIESIPQKIGTYWAIPEESERSLDWSKPVADIARTVRAFGKFESWANFDDRDWLVQDATVWVEKHEWPCGKVVHRTNREVVVAAVDGFVCIRRFKPEPPKK